MGETRESGLRTAIRRVIECWNAYNASGHGTAEGGALQEAITNLRLAAPPEPDLPALDVERLAEMLHDLDGTQHYITHEVGYDGDDVEGVECITGVSGHLDDARQLAAALDPLGVAPDASGEGT